MGQPPIEDVYVVEDETLFEEEDIRKYRPGGYHPVKLGDVFHERYRISHKLGHGGLSTVWLAWDKEMEIWVSIKIKTAASSTNATFPKLDEVEALRRLQQAPGWGNGPGSQRIVTMLDQFSIRGPNGDHHCLVFELLGPSIAAVMKNASIIEEDFPAEYFTPHQVFSFSVQLLQAVSFIHTTGISQGDISLNNIAFFWDQLSRMSEKDLFKMIKRPAITKVRRRDGAKLGIGVPREIITAVNWWHFPKSKLMVIKVIDFGEAFEGTIESRRLAQPIHLRSPESIILGIVGLQADLWRVGAAIYQMSMGCHFLGESPDADLVEGMIWLLARLPPNTPGDAPQEWPQAWCAAWNQIRADATSKGEYHPFERVLEPVLKGDFLGRFNDRRSHYRLRGLWPIIEDLLRLLPQQRVSASRALSMVIEVAQKGGSK